MNRLFGMLGFSILASLYLTIIFLLGRAAPFLFVFGLLAWMIIRQPVAFPDRANADIKQLADGVREMVRRLAEMLIYPLVNIR